MLYRTIVLASLIASTAAAPVSAKVVSTAETPVITSWASLYGLDARSAKMPGQDGTGTYLSNGIDKELKPKLSFASDMDDKEEKDEMRPMLDGGKNLPLSERHKDDDDDDDGDHVIGTPATADVASSKEQELIHAVSCKDEVGMMAFLDEGALSADTRQVHQYGKTLLMIAATKGWLAGVEKLLDRGADTTLLDAMGRSALYYAQRYCNHEKVAKMLRAHMPFVPKQTEAMCETKPPGDDSDLKCESPPPPPPVAPPSPPPAPPSPPQPNCKAKSATVWNCNECCSNKCHGWMEGKHFCD